MSTSGAKVIAYTAAMTALVYVMTCIAVPMPKPLGVWHLGDVASFIAAIMFGPKIGAFACGVGAALFDVWNPMYQSAFIQWAPATIVIRGIMGFILGKMRRIISNKPRTSELLAMIISHIWKNTAYFLYDYWLLGPVAYLDLITFFPLSAVDIIVTIPLMAAIRKAMRVEYVV
ncbi:MAG: ECF transporter S component [archaeon GB-1867-005]|nr:ECF transporter S component [Candidatus Culexmicrobium cathedralense]